MVMCYSDKQYLCNECCSFHFNETQNYIGVSVTLVIFIYQCVINLFSFVITISGYYNVQG